MANGNGRRAVTWPHLLAVMSALVALAGGALALHAAHPHGDSVHRRELEQMERRIDAGFAEVRRDLEEIKRRIR